MKNHFITARIAAIGLAAVVCGFAAQSARALTIETGDFVAEVERLKDLVSDYFSSDAGTYMPPDALQRADFSVLAATLLSGNIATADAQVGALNYELVEFTDTVSGMVYHGLRELGTPTLGWGSYFVNLSFVSDALVQAPHILNDTNSWEIAARAFRESGARGFVMAGAHRNVNGPGTGDVAHLAESMFQEVHKAWNGPTGATPVWQVHGFDLDKSDGSGGFVYQAIRGVSLDADAVLSNGDGGVSPDVIVLDGQLTTEGFESYAYNELVPDDPVNVQVNGSGVDGTSFASLRAFTNVQGIHSRGLGGVFIHIELEKSIRFNARNRAAAAAAIATSIHPGNRPELRLRR